MNPQRFDGTNTIRATLKPSVFTPSCCPGDKLCSLSYFDRDA